MHAHVVKKLKELQTKFLIHCA